jgi:hypothetical protein
MADGARVDDLDVFRIFRGALLKFAQNAGQAIMNADSQAARTMTWLETEQTAYWQGQLRKRTEAVMRAQEAVRGKKLFRDSAGRIPSAVEEEKQLAKCLAAVQQAQEKISAIRKAVPRLQKEVEVYRGGISALSGALSGEIPKAVAMLDAMASRMEEYVNMRAPGEGRATSDAFTTGTEAAPSGEMSRPAEEGAEGRHEGVKEGEASSAEGAAEPNVEEGKTPREAQ